MKRTRRTYSVGFKTNIAKKIMKNEITSYQVTDPRNGSQVNPAVVDRWVQAYEAGEYANVPKSFKRINKERLLTNESKPPQSVTIQKSAKEKYDAMFQLLPEDLKAKVLVNALEALSSRLNS